MGVPMARRLQRGTTPAPVKPLQGCRPNTLPTFLSLSCPISIQSLLHMVQHVADWVASFPHGQHSLPLSLKFLHTPPLTPPSPSLPYLRKI